MAKGIIHGVKISGISSCFPDNRLDNDYFVDYYDEKYIKRFERSTGIKTRYLVSRKQTASDLCYTAAKKLIEHKGIDIKGIGALIFLTETPDYKTPSTAFILQKRLGIGEEAIVFDINLGCTAAINGIVVVSSLIGSGIINSGLVLVGDAIPGRETTDDHNSSMLFSDAGSAIYIERGEGDIPYVLGSNGNDFQAIMNPHGERFLLDKENPDWDTCKYYMDGNFVFQFAADRVPRMIDDFVRVSGKQVAEYDHLVFHQANRFIINHIAHDMEIDSEMVPISIDRYANTNGASIPVTICDLVENGDCSDSLDLALCGFGVGLSWGMLGVRIEKKDVMPIIFSNDYYSEGTSIKYLDNRDQ